MNGGRVAKRLLAVVLAFSTLVTLGLYYNGGGRADDRPLQLQQSSRADDGPSNEVDAARPSPERGAARPAALSATVDGDTCPELALANTTVDTVVQFQQFDFQVRSRFRQSRTNMDLVQSTSLHTN